MKKIKVSWSILSAWASGNKDKALKMYLGIPIEKEDYETHGSLVHDKIATQRLALLPCMNIQKGIFEDYGKKINHFKLLLEDWLELVGVIDYLESYNFFIDWKTGFGKSSSHDPKQLYLYDLLLRGNGITSERGYIVKVDIEGGEIKNMNDYTIIVFSEEKRKFIKDWIITFASELYNELENQKII